ncbi:MAG: glycosyltransferase [Gammaproteobacteria bacterium]
MSKKQIVFLIPSLAGGGAEKIILRLAEGLSNQGHKISIILLHPQISYRVPENIDLQILKTKKKKGLDKLTYYWRASRELQSIIDNKNKVSPVDLVISNLPEMDRVAWYLRFKNVYYCIRNSLYQGYVAQNNGLKKIHNTIKLKRLYNGKKLVFISEGTKRDMLVNLRVTPLQSPVIYNPFPVQRIWELASLPLQRDLGDYFIHVGRFNQQKRHDRLLRLFAQSAVNDRLLLLGEGNDGQKKKITQLIQDYSLSEKVVAMDFQENPYPYIKNAKALMLTSDYEGLGNVLIEALLCGTPVISFDCPSGPSEILSSEFPESLIPMDDENKFVERLIKLSTKPERVTVSAAFIERFDENEIYRSYTELL